MARSATRQPNFQASRTWWLALIVLAAAPYTSRAARSAEWKRIIPDIRLAPTKVRAHPPDTLLRRGSFYAINVINDGASNGAPSGQANEFRLVQLHALGPRLLTSASALSAHLRTVYPQENAGWAYYADTYQEDGWYRLEIRIDQEAPFPDVVKARAAGFVEGNLQAPHMYRYWTNYRTNQYAGHGEAPSRELYDFLDEQFGWMTKKVQAATGWGLQELRGQTQGDGSGSSIGSSSGSGSSRTTSNGASSAGSRSTSGGTDGGTGGGGSDLSADEWDLRYWERVGLVAAQFEGLAAGFWAATLDSSRNMTWHELYTLNALGDLYELNVLFPPPAKKGEAAVAAAGEEGGEAAEQQQQQEGGKPARRYTAGHGEVGEYGYGEMLDCSAIIKIEDQDSDAGSDLGGAGDSGSSSGSTAGRRQSASAAAGRSGRVLGRRGRDGAGAGEAVAKRHTRGFWASHNTWRPYYDMVRTWKVYDFPWSATGPLVVSSSPGLLHSKDDWYTTDNLVVMETTNGVYNKSLYDIIQPRCVLMWQRAQVANFGAQGGADWVDLFGRHNSGTYNNQWMVLDIPRLQSGGTGGVLWVLEQLPGLTVSKDVSKVLLEQGYWASYNVPYFPEIYNLTAYPQPSIYHTCPRARIFRREQPRVTSTSDLMSLMRLNRYEDDPEALALPNNAIAARYDLLPGPDPSGLSRNYTRRAYGAVDAKVVDLESFLSRRTYVINGPTADDQPVFRWSTADPAVASGVRRDGCVDEFDFGWQAYQSVMGPETAAMAA